MKINYWVRITIKIIIYKDKTVFKKKMSFIKRISKTIFGQQDQEPEPEPEQEQEQEQKIVLNEISENEVEKMTAEERWVRASLRENAERFHASKTTKKRKREENHFLEETIFSCPNCESKIVAVYQIQTRGGDEAITTFFTCKKCKHRWCEN